MAFYVDCNRSIFEECLKAAREAVAENGIASGYEAGLFEQVRRQAEIIYEVVCAKAAESIDVCGISGDWLEIYQEASFEMKHYPEEMKTLAVYDIALLTALGLHPLFIPCKEQALVGVWLYSDFDYEEAVIRNQNFISESFENGGMLLAFSVESQMEGKAFSDAVRSGSSHLQDYICAVDVSIENSSLEGDMIIEKSATSAASEKTERPAAVQTEEAFEVPDKSAPDAAVTEKEAIIPEIRNVSLNEAMEEIVYGAGQAVKGGVRTMVIGNQLTDKIRERLDKERLLSFALDLTREDETAAMERLISMKPLEPSRRLQLAYRLYEENKKRYDYYLEILDGETIPGYSLISLMEEASAAQDDTLAFTENNETQKIIFSNDRRSIFSDYCQAWNQCIYKSPDDKNCFDLTEFSGNDIKQLREMTGAAEIVIRKFLTELNKFGYLTGMIYDPEGSMTQKKYFSSLMAVNDFLIACLDFQSAREAELPEATQEEQLLLDDYMDYVAYRESAEQAGERVNLSNIAELSEEELSEIMTLANRLLDSDLENLSWPIPRQVSKDFIELDGILQENNITHKMYGIRPKLCMSADDWAIVLCRLLVNADLISKYINNDKYASIYDAFGSCSEDEAYIFALKSSLVDHYKQLAGPDGISDECRRLVDELYETVLSDDGELSDRQEIVLDKANTFLQDYYTPFHSMEKEIFEFLGLSYRAFDEKYEDRMLMDFILDWKDMLKEGGVYDSYIHCSAALDRACLGNLARQAHEAELSPLTAKDAFDQAFLKNAAAFWMREKGFDLTDYEMTVRSLQSTEGMKKEAEKITDFNNLLETYRSGQAAFTLVLGDTGHAIEWLQEQNEADWLLLITNRKADDNGDRILPLPRSGQMIIYNIE